MSKEYSKKCDRADRRHYAEGSIREEQPEALKALRDPLIRQAHEAYRASRTYRLDQLLAERSRWSRKLTIASNKLVQVNADLMELARELAKELDGGTNEAKSKSA